jgi:hypothetical protein
MEQGEDAQSKDATDDWGNYPISLDLVLAADPVLSELWSNEKDSEYDRI